MQTVCVVDSGLPEAVELVRGPEMGGKLFHKLGGGVDPIEMLELGRKIDVRECLEPGLR